MNDQQKSEMLDFMAKSTSGTFEKCLFPKSLCENKSVNSHSNLNTNTLDLLAKNAHVTMMKVKYNGARKPVVTFKPVASTLALPLQGLCSQHNTDIFNEIDSNDFDPTSEAQLFLIFYRTILTQLHVNMDNAIKMQTAYQIQAEQNQSDEPSQSNLDENFAVIKAFDISEFKGKLDAYYLKDAFSEVTHKIVILENQKPTICVSSLFYMDDINNYLVGLNIFPIAGNKTVVIFSFEKKDALAISLYIDSYIEKTDKQTSLLSKLVISNCENFVISQSYFSSWSLGKKNAILKSYVATLMNPEVELNNKHINLFV
ncbi:MAG: hypothetical protein HRU38_11125 [Saccharospirillaceae bacterium]|nr:hypothetical protein [Pseudomonadales bacterium]NRB79205.1 hypothetical protein [Saccharospirillaceae bacterium]